MFGIGKSAEERHRDKERKKRGARKYGQANFKHSRMGIVSCINSMQAVFSMHLWQEEMHTGSSADWLSCLWSCPLTESALQSKDSVSVNAII